MRIGIIGMGFMGGVHLKAWRAIAGAEVVAVCNASPIGARARQGNLNTGSDALDLDDVTIYTDSAEMLQQESLDAVSITLPTHLHKAVSLQVLAAGVHVLCEKPMALSVEDCDAMIDAAKAADRQLMVGHCIRFWPEYAWLKQSVESGAFGSVRSADFSRLTSAPAWASDSWMMDESSSGGLSLDLHIHDLDFMQYLFGVPDGIRSDSVLLESGVVGHIRTSFDYASHSMISATASWMMPKSFGFEMSFRVVFQQTSVVFDGVTLKVYPAEGDPYEPDIPDGDGYLHQIKYFYKLISGEGNKVKITSAEARESVRLALEAIK